MQNTLCHWIKLNTKLMGFRHQSRKFAANSDETKTYIISCLSPCQISHAFSMHFPCNFKLIYVENREVCSTTRYTTAKVKNKLKNNQEMAHHIRHLTLFPISFYSLFFLSIVPSLFTGLLFDSLIQHESIVVSAW